MSSLTIDRLEKSYGNLQVLRDMSFQVRPGEIYGFISSNGAGKTTTMRITLSVLVTDRGEIRIGDTSMNDSLRRAIGYMPEKRGLYPKAEIRKQLIYFARLHGVPTERAESNAKNLLERLGLTERTDNKVGTLSLGNQQRVQLAAPLIHDPEVLVLDEPFSGLNPVAVKVTSSVLKEYTDRDTPIMSSSHQFDLVERMCGRAGTIRDGRTLVEGTVEELRARSPQAFVVKLDGASQGWALSVEGVTSVGRDTHGTAVVHLGSDVPAGTDQKLLHSAMATGTVRSFESLQIPFTELYQEAIQQ